MTNQPDAQNVDHRPVRFGGAMFGKTRVIDSLAWQQLLTACRKTGINLGEQADRWQVASPEECVAPRPQPRVRPNTGTARPSSQTYAADPHEDLVEFTTRANGEVTIRSTPEDRP